MICKRCAQERPATAFKNQSKQCQPCWSAVRKRDREPANAYYRSPEYKRIGWERKCKREGREYLPGRGRKAGIASQLRAARRKPDEIADSTWRALENTNATQAWAYWLEHLAPSWWLEKRKAILTAKANRAGNPAYRAIWRAARQARRARKLNQADGSLSNADVARMIRTAKDCMWCGVVLTLPVHKRYEPTMATIEHIVPLCQGGLHSKDNVGVACAHCNYSRAKRAA